MDVTERAVRFRALHESGIFVAPNPWNTGTARILAHLGYEALATTSAGLAFSLGLGDGLAAVDLDRTLDHCAEIVAATPLPVTADLENGFGDSPEAAVLAIRRAGEIGLCGGSIEDATYDENAPLYDRALAVERIQAAVEAARSLPHDFVLTARTEGFIRGRPDFAETLARLQAFSAAGADVVYAPGLPDLGSVRTVCAEAGKPVNFVVGVSGFSCTVAELRDAGVRRISTGSSLARAAFGGMLDAAREIADEGSFSYIDPERTVGSWNRYFS